MLLLLFNCFHTHLYLNVEWSFLIFSENHIDFVQCDPYFYIKYAFIISWCFALGDMVLEKDEVLEACIVELLDSVHLTGKTKGRAYLISAINKYCIHPEKYKKNIYRGLFSEVAQTHDTSSANVEKDIRKAIENAWTRGNPCIQYELYGSIVKGDKPTAALFIIRSAEIIKSRLG